MSALGRDERGVVMVEFLMAILPVLLLFLGAVQLLLLGAARLVVSHAAVAAARSAAVVLDDDPVAYAGEPRGHLDSPHESARPPTPAAPFPVRDQVPGLALLVGAKTRLDVIRRAANAPLSAFAPSPAEVARWFAASRDGTVEGAIGGSPLVRTLGGISFYDRAALALRVDEPADAASSDLVTAHVTYLAHCAIPLVSLLICARIVTLSDADPALRRSLADVPAPELTRALGLTGERFVAFSAVASFPRQRASYLRGSGG